MSITEDINNVIIKKLSYSWVDEVLAYVDDVNLIGDDIKTIERNADVLLNACKDICFIGCTNNISSVCTLITIIIGYVIL